MKKSQRNVLDFMLGLFLDGTEQINTVERENLRRYGVLNSLFCFGVSIGGLKQKVRKKKHLRSLRTSV